MPATERTAPPIPKHDAAIERAILGAPLQADEASAEALALILTRTRPEHFLLDKNRIVRATFDMLIARGKPVDVLTLGATLRDSGDLERLGHGYLEQLFDEASIPAHVGGYIDVLIDCWRARRIEQLQRALAGRNGANTEQTVAQIREALAELESERVVHDTTPQIIDAADLITREFADEPALVGGGLIVPRALVVNGGPAKRGKSALVLNREICRAFGLPFLGFSTTPGRTLYIQAEIPEPQLQARLVKMLNDCPGRGRLDGEALRNHLLTVTQRGLFIDEPAGYDAVRRLIEQAEPDLLSLDPLARFMTGEENSARDVGRLINSLDRLIQEYRIAIELTHHAGKPTTGDPRHGGQRLRGSSALFGAADTVTMLDRTQDAWLLSFELRHAEEPAPMPLDRTPSLWFTTAGPPEKLIAVALIVKDLPMRYTTLSAAIIADTKCSEPTAKRLIRDAKKAGLVWQGDDGLYRQSIKRYHGGADTSGTDE